jgi:GT2 family glycosyltransferase
VLQDGVERTSRCLAELARVTRGVDYEVVLVDRGSRDATPAFLSTLGGDVQVIRCEADVRPSAAANMAARVARGRHLVFLAPEVIPRDGWLRALADEADAHPDVTAVGSKLLRRDRTIWHAGFAVSRVHAAPYPIYRGFPANFPGAARRRETQAVSGACLLVRREAFDAVGGFDEAFGDCFGDVDLCLRLRARGAVVYQPRSVVYQEGEERGTAADREDAERLRERWGERWLADEDATYVADGYAYRARNEGGVLRESLEPLTEAPERVRWERVAEVQRVARAAGLDAARPLLDEPEAWPDDPAVLAWAAGLCTRAGLSGQAATFRSRLAGNAAE